LPPHTVVKWGHYTSFAGYWNYPHDGGTRPLFSRQCFHTPKMHACSFRLVNAFPLSLGAQLCFKLGNDGEHIEHQAPCRCVRIHLLVEDMQMNAFPGELVRDRTEMQRGAGETIEACHQQRIALPYIVETGL
jgi:hypothetical protein